MPFEIEMDDLEKINDVFDGKVVRKIYYIE